MTLGKTKKCQDPCEDTGILISAFTSSHRLKVITRNLDCAMLMCTHVAAAWVEAAGYNSD